MPPPKDPKKYEEWRRKQSESHKGKITWMKGKKHTEEAKRLQREAKLGKPKSEETRRLMSISHKGQIPWQTGKTGVYSKEHLEKLRIAAIGNRNAKGHKHTDEWKKDQSGRQTGENNVFYGKKHTDETKLKISKINMGKVPWIKGKNHSQETRERLKITRMNQVFPRKDSKPERIMQIALALRGVVFEKHKPIYGQPDIFIEPNICIFIDGDYWHNRPEVKERDLEVNDTLTKQRYEVIRIWEKDIQDDPNKTVDIVLKRVLEIA